VSRPNVPGAGSTALLGQLPSETKCPDPPANLFPARLPGPDPAQSSPVRGRFLRGFLGETTCPVPASASRQGLRNVSGPASPRSVLPPQAAGDLFLPYVKMDPHHRRGSFFVPGGDLFTSGRDSAGHGRRATAPREAEHNPRASDRSRAKAAISIEPQKPDSAKISFAKFGLGRPRKFGRWSRTGRRPSVRRRSY